jgi:hypothetical protein
MRSPQTGQLTWVAIVIVSVISAGAYVGNEAAQYFWDLSEYVHALDTEFPYRYEKTYPFLYPPVAKHLFTLAKSHLFELLSIGYVAAGALLLTTVARISAPRRFEWLAALTAMGGLGVVSLLSGNDAILMNLTLLAIMLRAAMGQAPAHTALPFVIGLGTLIKPQFIVFAALLLFLERSRKMAIVKMAAIGLGAGGVHLLYTRLRPHDWSEYTQAVIKRTVVERDFAWGPAGFIRHFADSNTAGLVAAIIGFVVVASLATLAWRRSVHAPKVATISLVFIALSFVNPRMPPYDVYAVLLALSVCCAYSAEPRAIANVLLVMLVFNLTPWLIKEFAREPSAWPWWTMNTQIGHLLGLVTLLATLARTGLSEPSLVTQGRDRIDA